MSVELEEREPTPEDIERAEKTKDFARRIEDAYTGMFAQDPQVRGYYIMVLMATSDPKGDPVQTHVFDVGKGIPSEIIAEEHHNKMHFWISKHKMEETFGMMERIMEHKEVEMKALQLIYEKCKEDIPLDKPTKNMMIKNIEMAPSYLLFGSSPEHLMTFIDRFEYSKEEEVIDRILTNLKTEIVGDLDELPGGVLPREVILMAAKAAAIRTKKAMHLDITVEQLTHKFAMAIDPEMEKMR